MWALRAGVKHVTSSSNYSSNPPDYEIDTSFNGEVALGDGVGAVGDPNFEYSSSVSGPGYHEEVLVVGQAPSYPPISFNLNMTGRYLYAQAQRNAHNAAIQAHSLRVADGRSWGYFAHAVEMGTLGGAVGTACVAAFSACTKAASYYGFSATAKSGYDILTNPTIGNGYRFGVNASREIFTALATNGAPAPVKPIIWFNAVSGEVMGRIPIE